MAARASHHRMVPSSDPVIHGWRGLLAIGLISLALWAVIIGAIVEFL